jgi:hypothetical protein
VNIYAGNIKVAVEAHSLSGIDKGEYSIAFLLPEIDTIWGDEQQELRKQAAGVSKYDPLYQKAIPSETTQQAAKNLPSQKKSVNEAMAIKTAEKDATIKAVKELPLLTQEQKNEILMDPRKLDEYSYLTRLQEPDTVKDPLI